MQYLCSLDRCLRFGARTIMYIYILYTHLVLYTFKQISPIKKEQFYFVISLFSTSIYCFPQIFFSYK